MDRIEEIRARCAYADSIETSHIDCVEVSELKFMLDEIDAMKAENEQWNDADCNTCPLSGWEACDEKCISKAMMIEFAKSLAQDIDVKLAALLEAEAENERLKAEVCKHCEPKTSENGIATYHDCRECQWRGLAKQAESGDGI